MSASFFWIELVRGERPPELLAIERVLARRVPADLRGAERAPRDAVARAVEAAERALESLRRSAAGFPPGTSTSSITISPVTDVRRLNLPSIFGAESPFIPFSRMKPRITPSSVFAQTTNTSAIGAFEIHILLPDEPVAAGAPRARVIIEPGIGAVVRLGQAEAADPLAGRELRQVFPALRLRAIRVDREHHERALHAHHRTVAGVDALDLARDQAVADVVESGAAVFGRQRRRRGVRARPFRETRSDRRPRGETPA